LVLPEFPQQREAADPRQQQVEDDGGVGAFTCEAKRIDSVCRRVDGEPVRLEALDNEGQDPRFIFYDQDSRAARLPAWTI
jgi:hypothetical protein